MHRCLGRITPIVTLSLWLFFLSCNSRDQSEAKNKEKIDYHLEKVDSVHIDRANQVTMLDFHSGSNRFLAYDQITEEFLVLDKRGEVLDAVYRKGEGPNEYNSSLLAASFNQEGEGFYTLSSTDFLW